MTSTSAARSEFQQIITEEDSKWSDVSYGNKRLHPRALALYSDVSTLVEAGIESRGEKPYIELGATKADVGRWKREDERLQPWLETKVDFVSIFRQEVGDEADAMSKGQRWIDGTTKLLRANQTALNTIKNSSRWGSKMSALRRLASRRSPSTTDP